LVGVIHQLLREIIRNQNLEVAFFNIVDENKGSLLMQDAVIHCQNGHILLSWQTI
jgi:hypothetical protein